MGSDTDKLPRGLICPLVTPLKTGDVLDVAVLERLINHVGVGADAILIGEPFWAESLVLSSKTRLEMATAVLEIVQGKWPLLITITSHTSKATRDLMARTEAFIERSDYPGRVFWVDYPIYHHSNRGLPELYEAMDRDTGIGFILGNHPGLVKRRKRPVKHRSIRTSVLKKMSEIQGVRGLVFAGSLKRSMNYHRAVGHRRDFTFFDGDEAAFLRQPGSNGVVAGGANLLPVAWRQITWSCLNRYDVQRQYADHTSQILETGAMLQEFAQLYLRNRVAVVKRMLHVAGVLPNAHIASATPPLTGGQKQEVEALCKKHDLV